MAVAVHATFYVRYKNGQYTTKNTSYTTYGVKKILPPVKYLSLQNMAKATIIISDTGKLSFFDTAAEKDYQVTTLNDTLYLVGKEGRNSNSEPHPVLIQVAPGALVKAENTNVTIGNTNGVARPSLSMQLNGAEVLVQDSAAYSSLNVNAFGNARVMLNGMKVSNLTIAAHDASFDAYDIAVDSVHITKNKGAVINMSSKNIGKGN